MCYDPQSRQLKAEAEKRAPGSRYNLRLFSKNFGFSISIFNFNLLASYNANQRTHIYSIEFLFQNKSDGFSPSRILEKFVMKM